MAKKNDFIFYEADAMLILVNPFVDINVDNVGKAFIHQKPLKVSDGSSTSWIYNENLLQGISRNDAETVLSAMKAFENMARGQVEGIEEVFEPLLRIMCREIVKQKKRLGGDFAVAQAVMSREATCFRDLK